MMQKRLFAIGLTLLFGVALADSHSDAEASCLLENHCIEDGRLRVQVRKVRVRGNVANVSVLLTNLTDEEQIISIYGEYLSATSFTGERIDLRTNRQETPVLGGATRSLGYSLEFDEPVDGGIDLVLIFERPNTSYAFFDLKPEQKQE